MTGANWAQLGLMTLLPVVAAMAVFLLEQRTAFSLLRRRHRQVIIGIAFGLVAIVETEFGVALEDAVVNVRDAAPLAAGLLFGGPAGIIAGVVGGVERWLAASWGKGEFTQVACSVATVAAGLYAALLRKHMFENKKPTLTIAFCIGVVIEVLHLSLIFITNPLESERAFEVVKACAVPMTGANALAVMLSVLAVMLLGGERLRMRPELRELSRTVQSGMLVVTMLAFAVTTVLNSGLQSNLARAQTRRLLEINIADVRAEVSDASDKNLLKVTREIADLFPSVSATAGYDLSVLVDGYNVTEINTVDKSGKIVASTDQSIVGTTLSKDDAEGEFLFLNDSDQDEFVRRYEPTAKNASVWRKYAVVAIEGGFVQVGYDDARFQKDIEGQIQGITRWRHVGSTGLIVIADADGVIVSAPEDAEGFTLEEVGLGNAEKTQDPDALITTSFAGCDAYGMVEHNEGYTIVALLPLEEAKFARNVAVLVGSFMEIVVFAAFFAALFFLIKWLVVNNIHKVNRTLASITEGDLDATVDVRTNEEFALLSDDINQTVATLKRYIAEADARIDAELEYARTIQRSALPQVFPPYPSHTEFEIFASMTAAKEVGGDFYDFYLIDDDHLAFIVADVSGKGIPAAMFMMTSKTLIKSLAESGLPVEKVFSQANEKLCSNNDAEMFVTAWMGVLDLESGHISFANAGHNPPAIMHADGTVEYLRTRANLVLAGMEGIPYRAHELVLEAGDTLFLYTDGVTEATDSADRLYGEDRLVETLHNNVDGTTREICENVHNDVDAFVGDAPQFDDITVLALRYLGRTDSCT